MEGGWRCQSMLAGYKETLGGILKDIRLTKEDFIEAMRS
jgi:hypothetical protein